MVQFGERLKQSRNAKHLSQQALAEIIGKSLNTVGLYERGLRQPSLETLCLLADVLDASTDYLLARTEVKNAAAVTQETSEMTIEARLQRLERKIGL